MSRPPKISAGDLALRLMSQGPTPASELADRFRVDRSTITRTLGDLGKELASFGATRRTRYALRRKVREMDAVFPLYRIDDHGRAHHWGQLEAFHRAWRMSWTSAPPDWASRFSDPEAVWKVLPFFLGDFLCQGPLPAAAGRSHRLPDDPSRWDEDDALQFVASWGEDLPGDLVVGDDCLRRALALQVTPDAESSLAPHQAMLRYPEWAARTAAGWSPGGASAPGQAVFMATLEESSLERRPVVVKFSPPMSQLHGRRWADLLAMEFHALSVLAEAGLPTAPCRLIDAGGRRFLEIARWDRTPQGGRRGYVSLGALQGALSGESRTDWTGRVVDLHGAGLVDAATIHESRRLQAFAEFVGAVGPLSGDLHFQFTDTLPLALAPLAGLAPLFWAPGPQGELMERNFAPQPPVPASAEAWREMLPLAREFWVRVIADQRVSREFAATARAAGEVLARLAERFG